MKINGVSIQDRQAHSQNNGLSDSQEKKQVQAHLNLQRNYHVDPSPSKVHEVLDDFEESKQQSKKYIFLKKKMEVLNIIFQKPGSMVTFK